MTPYAIQSLVYARTGNLMSKNAVEYIQDLQKKENSMSGDGESLTAAEEVLKYVQSREDISYFVVQDDPILSLITFPKKRGPKKKQMIKTTVIKLNGAVSESSEAIEVDDETAEYVERKRNDLRIKDATKSCCFLHGTLMRSDGCSLCFQSSWHWTCRKEQTMHHDLWLFLSEKMPTMKHLLLCVQ